MHRTLTRARQPLIKFIGKHHFTPHAPTFHPAAPPEVQQNFASFLKRSQAGSSAAASSPSSSKASKGTNAQVYEWWEVPEKYWRRDLTNSEINAVMSGGASAW